MCCIKYQMKQSPFFRRDMVRLCPEYHVKKTLLRQDMVSSLCAVGLAKQSPYLVYAMYVM